MLGIGPFPNRDEAGPDLINAGRQTVTAMRAAASFSSAENFAMIRGHHIDLAVLGAMEGSAKGDLSNWTIPGKMMKGMGGAMDLVAGLTGGGVVALIVTDLCIFSCDEVKGELTLIEQAPGVTADALEQRTGAAFLHDI